MLMYESNDDLKSLSIELLTKLTEAQRAGRSKEARELMKRFESTFIAGMNMLMESVRDHLYGEDIDLKIAQIGDLLYTTTVSASAGFGYSEPRAFHNMLHSNDIVSHLFSNVCFGHGSYDQNICDQLGIKTEGRGSHKKPGLLHGGHFIMIATLAPKSRVGMFLAPKLKQWLIEGFHVDLTGETMNQTAQGGTGISEAMLRTILDDQAQKIGKVVNEVMEKQGQIQIAMMRELLANNQPAPVADAPSPPPPVEKVIPITDFMVDCDERVRNLARNPWIECLARIGRFLRYRPGVKDVTKAEPISNGRNWVVVVTEDQLAELLRDGKQELSDWIDKLEPSDFI